MEGENVALIRINNDKAVNGKLTVKRYLDAEGAIHIEGTFATHWYFEEITQLDTFRYEIKGVEVLEEIFGSDDFDIVYNFRAEEINNVYGATNLNMNQINSVENIMYGFDGYLLNTDLEKVISKSETEEK